MSYSRQTKLVKKLVEKKQSLSKSEISELVNKCFAIRTNKVSVKYDIKNDTPRWAYKYRFSRKKYGVKTHEVNESIIKPTAKAMKLYRKLIKMKSID